MVEWVKRIKEKMRDVEKTGALEMCVEDSESVQREIEPC
jgi:hypothetical protein